MSLLNENKEILLPLISSFFGAFFAFCFFIFGDKFRRKKEWRKIYLNEHAYLDRYLQNIIVFLDINISFYATIKEQYQNNSLPLRGLMNLPVREDASMRLKDMDFLNDIEKFIINVKTTNSDIDAFNSIREKMNSSVEKFIIEPKEVNFDKKSMVERSINEFIEDSKTVNNFQKMLKDDALDILAENIFLYNLYKTNFINRIKINFQINFNKNYKEKIIKNIKDEKVIRAQESLSDYKKKLEKYNIK